MAPLFGEIDSDKLAAENLSCRQIVSEIMNFGVTQRQIWYIMYLLSLNLEDVDEMREAVGFIKEFKGDALFLSGMNGATDGKNDQTVR